MVIWLVWFFSLGFASSPKLCRELWLENDTVVQAIASPVAKPVNAIGNRVNNLFHEIVNSHYQVNEILSDFVANSFHRLPDVMDPLRLVFLKKDIEAIENMSSEKAADSILNIVEKNNPQVLVNLVKKLESRRAALLQELEALSSSQSYKYQTLRFANLLRRSDSTKVVQIKGQWLSIIEASEYISNHRAESVDVNALRLQIAIANLMPTGMGLEDAYAVAVRILRRGLTEDGPLPLEEAAFTYFAQAVFKNLDPHSSFFSDKDLKAHAFSVSKRLPLGMSVVEHRDGFKIDSLVESSLAEKSGLQLNDLIISINGVSYQTINVPLAQFFMMQAKPILDLEVVRERSLKKITVDRSKTVYKEQNPLRVQVSTLGNIKFASIYLPSFYLGAAKDMQDMVQKLKEQGTQGIVLDLRGNKGGGLQDATNILELFLNNNQVLWHLRYNNGQVYTNLTYAIDRPRMKQIFEGPLVILVDSMSASASELVAASVKALGRGIIVGASHTYGKGSSQTVIGQQYKITNALFYGPDGYSPQWYGVKSDILIKDTNGSSISYFEKDLANSIVPQPLHTVNSNDKQKTTIAEISELRRRSQDRQKHISDAEDSILHEANQILKDWIEILR